VIQARHSKTPGRVVALYREFSRKLRQVGFWETARSGARKLIRSKKQNSHEFDLKHGTDTSGIIEPGALDISAEMAVHAVRYQTAIVDVFLEILSSLAIPYNDFVFIDLGSGKGRALLLASQFPFKEIIGVELSPRLHHIASQNIQIYNDAARQSRRIRSVCGDAASFEIPTEPLYFYLFNPFDESVLRAVLMNIECSFQNDPRKIYISYLKPVHHHVLEQTAFLRTAKQTERYIIYESIPVPEVKS
jgi:SAM-dependent methyltransferase